MVSPSWVRCAAGKESCNEQANRGSAEGSHTNSDIASPTVSRSLDMCARAAEAEPLLAISMMSSAKATGSTCMLRAQCCRER